MDCVILLWHSLSLPYNYFDLRFVCIQSRHATDQFEWSFFSVFPQFILFDLMLLYMTYCTMFRLYMANSLVTASESLF